MAYGKRWRSGRAIFANHRGSFAVIKLRTTSSSFNLWYSLVAVEAAESLFQELLPGWQRVKAGVDLVALLLTGRTPIQALFGLHSRVSRRALALAFLLRACLTERFKSLGDRVAKVLYALRIHSGFTTENLLLPGSVYEKSSSAHAMLVSLMLTVIKARDWIQTELTSTSSLDPIPFPNSNWNDHCHACGEALSNPMAFDSQGHLFHPRCCPTARFLRTTD